MNKKLLTGIIAGAAVFGSVAAVPVIANAQTQETRAGNGYGYGAKDGSGNGNGNGYQASLESRAGALGLTAEQLQEKLKTQTMLQIAEDQGINQEQFQAKMAEAAKKRWESRGLSEAQIQERVQAQEERQADCDGSGERQAQRHGARSVN